jgi:hypothetical protein
MVERIENPRPGQVREAQDGQRAKMLVAQHRLDAAAQRGVDKDAVQIDRRVGNSDAVPLRRDRAVQVGQRLAVIERPHLRHEAGQQIERAVSLGDEPCKVLTPVPTLLLPAGLQQRPLGLGLRIGGRHIEERQMIGALEMLPALAFEGSAPFFIDEPGGWVGEPGFGIAERFDPLRLEEQRPARAEPAQDIVRPSAGRDEFCLCRAFEVGTAKTQGPLEAAILVEDDTGCDQRRPRQMVGEAIGAVAIFGEVQHVHHAFWRRWRASTGAKSGSRLAAKTASEWPSSQSTIPAIHI